MKKFIYLYLFFIGYSTVAHAQRFPFSEQYGRQIVELPKETTLEQARLKFLYQHMTLDPEIDKTEVEYDVLLVGKKYALYKNYYYFRHDSTLQHYNREKMTNKEYFFIQNKINEDGIGENRYILRNLSTGKMEVHVSMLPDRYIYEEDRLDFKWKMEEGTRSVCGYRCKKATCTFRGRKWTAWYATNIEQSLGPWKFGGLPGMILLVEDSKREHVFTAISIRKGDSNSRINKFMDNSLKTNRVWFNKAKRNYELGFLDQQKAAGVTITNTDGSEAKLPKKRPFVFNPIEKE